jgi:ATP-dependent DNA ligase
MSKSPFAPCRCTEVPISPDRLHEINYDGFALLVVRHGKRVRLITRNGHDWTDGSDLFRAGSRFGLEGMVSKRRDSRYRAGRSPHWLKTKNPKHPSVKRVKDAF